MPNPSPILREQEVLEKCGYYIRIGYWQGPQKPNPRAWLENFKGEERELAVYLLNTFQFLSEHICTQMFERTIKGLSQHICHSCSNHTTARAAWDEFYRSVTISHVPGEKPNPTDSGYHYVRLARQFLNIPQDRIAEPSKALQMAMEGKPVLFVDDFIGSGQQFINLWKSSLDVKWSFEKCSQPLSKLRVYYCPLIATQYGIDAISKNCPGANVRPLHTLDDSYNVLNAHSSAWPKGFHQKGVDMIAAVCSRIKIPPQGFHQLSLSLSFHNSTPDATLPLYYHEDHRWEHLVRRS